MKKSVLLTICMLVLIMFMQACGSGNKKMAGLDAGYNDAGYTGYYENAPDGAYRYDEVKEGGFVTAEVKNTSAFSLDRNTTGYSLARRQIGGGLKIAENSVRIEEYVNYFSYDYKKPLGDSPLAISGSLSDCPWNEETKLFTIGVAAKEIDFSNRKQNNLVFLLDVSGSMYGDDRLGLIQNAFTMLTENLNDDDYVSIVTYASGTRVAAEGLRGSEKVKISNILQDLRAGGSTNGEGGLELAYKVAEKYFIKGGNNRVMLATDGDFNVGKSDKGSLNEYISEKRESGVYLSVFGVGMYNTRDDIMETLARNGNGNYGYLDSLTEARKMLVTEMGGTLETVAEDAKINVTFNAEKVEKFRLIGYENKMMTEEEFNDEDKDAGEIGSGHTVTAVYEIKLKDNRTEGEFATAKIKCKLPESAQSTEIDQAFDLALYSSERSEDTIFIGCVTEFGLLLRNSAYKGNSSWDNLLSRLQTLPSVTGADADEFRAEFLELVKKAQKVYQAQR